MIKQNKTFNKKVSAKEFDEKFENGVITYKYGIILVWFLSLMIIKAKLTRLSMV